MRLLCAWLAALVAIFVATTASAAPITLFDNGSFSGPQVVRNNGCAVFDDDGICTSRFTIYDQFVLENNSVIARIEWHQTEVKPENYLGTRLTIGSGIPTVDSLLHTFLVTADRVLILIPDNDPRFESIPSGAFEALASVSGLNIMLAAGTYWLGIHNMYPHNVFPLTGGGSQWSQTSGTNQSIAGRWQGEGVVCGNFPIGPDGGCLKFFPDENSAFRLLSTVAIAIDIKPGSDPNCFNVNGNGVIPVAMLGTADFDVLEIDTLTLFFAGLEVRMRAKKGPLCHGEDTNVDGFLDLVCQFEDDPTMWTPDSSAEGTLAGTLFDGTEFEGTDTICVTQEVEEICPDGSLPPCEA